MVQLLLKWTASYQKQVTTGFHSNNKSQWFKNINNLQVSKCRTPMIDEMVDHYSKLTTTVVQITTIAKLLTTIVN